MDQTFNNDMLQQTLREFSTTTVREWMHTPPMFAPSEVTVHELLNDIMLPNVASEIPITASDGTLLGMAYLDDVTALPHYRWKALLAAEIVRPVELSKIISPDDQIDAGVTLLLSGEENIRSVPVCSGGMLLGELRRSDVIDRLKGLGSGEQPHLPSERTERLRFETPVLCSDGKRIGRLTRLAVDARDRLCTHVILRLDGIGGREVTLPADQIAYTNSDWILTRLSEAEFADLPNFATYELTLLPGVQSEFMMEPLLPQIIERNPLPQTTVCLDYRTRIWAGTQSLGRLSDFVLDANAPKLLGLGYTSGLVFHKQHYLPAAAIQSMTETRISADPSKLPAET